jgi:hypothetical protein
MQMSKKAQTRAVGETTRIRLQWTLLLRQRMEDDRTHEETEPEQVAQDHPETSPDLDLSARKWLLAVGY